jgi:hypothetical protein
LKKRTKKLYTYVGNDPIDVADPSGRVPGIGTALGALGGAIAGFEDGAVAAAAQKATQGGCLTSGQEAFDLVAGVFEGLLQGAVVGIFDPVPGSEAFAGAVSVAGPANLAAAAAAGVAAGAYNNGGGGQPTPPTKPSPPPNPNSNPDPDSAPSPGQNGGGGGGCG